MASLVLIKPDAFEHKLVGTLISWFEFWPIVAMRQTRMISAMCEAHYVDHVGKSFYPGLETFMRSGPVVALYINGDVNLVRDAALRIRQYWKHLVNNPRNLVHASDSYDAATRELLLWFPH